MTISLTGIFRYPVKGLAAETLESTSIVTGETIAHDRRFAIAHGSTELDPANPAWLPKTAFLMLMRDEKLAQLAVHFEPEGGVLTLTPYHHWRRSHNIHHATASDLERRGTGDIWTLTVKEYFSPSIAVPR